MHSIMHTAYHQLEWCSKMPIYQWCSHLLESQLLQRSIQTSGMCSIQNCAPLLFAIHPGTVSQAWCLWLTTLPLIHVHGTISLVTQFWVSVESMHISSRLRLLILVSLMIYAAHCMASRGLLVTLQAVPLSLQSLAMCMHLIGLQYQSYSHPPVAATQVISS
jgi:hypothetical protein